MSSKSRRAAKRRRLPPPGAPRAEKTPAPDPRVPPLSLPRRGADAGPEAPPDLLDHQPDLPTLHRVLAGLRGLS